MNCGEALRDLSIEDGQWHTGAVDQAAVRTLRSPVRRLSSSHPWHTVLRDTGIKMQAAYGLVTATLLGDSAISVSVRSLMGGRDMLVTDLCAPQQQWWHAFALWG